MIAPDGDGVSDADKDHMEAFLDPEFCRLIEHYLVSNYLAGAQQY